MVMDQAAGSKCLQGVRDTLNKGGSAGLLVLGPGFLYVRHLLPGPLMVLPCDFVPGRAVASPEAPY